jgi:hypothetical protein
MKKQYLLRLQSVIPTETWLMPLASRRFWLIRLLELYYLRSHFSISPTGGWQVVRCEIRFGDRSLAMTVSLPLLDRILPQLT